MSSVSFVDLTDLAIGDGEEFDRTCPLRMVSIVTYLCSLLSPSSLATRHVIVSEIAPFSTTDRVPAGRSVLGTSPSSVVSRRTVWPESLRRELRPVATQKNRRGVDATHFYSSATRNAFRNIINRCPRRLDPLTPLLQASHQVIPSPFASFSIGLENGNGIFMYNFANAIHFNIYERAAAM